MTKIYICHCNAAISEVKYKNYSGRKLFTIELNKNSSIIASALTMY